MSVTITDRPDRKSYIGGSDLGKILGISCFGNAIDLYRSKKSGDMGVLLHSDAIKWGNKLEPLILEEIPGGVANDKFHVDSEYSFMGGLPDGFREIDTGIDGMPEKILIEIKTASEKREREFSELKVPQEYYAQVQWYLMLTKLSKAQVWTLIGGRKMVVTPIKRNDEFIKEARAKAIYWWENYYSKGIEPTITVKKPQDDKEITELTYDEYRSIKDKYQEYVMAKSYADELYNIYKNACIYDNAYYQGNKVYTHTKSYINRFDVTRFKSERSDLYKEYMTKTEQDRVRFYD